MLFYQRPIIIVDFETTGLNPRRHDIIEIGAIRVDQENLLEQDRFNNRVRIQNPNTVQPVAMQVNGYNADVWEDAPPLAEVMEPFSDFIAGGVLAAWNITFEYGFLSEAFTRTNIPDPMDHHRIDIPTLAWLKFPRLEHFSQNDIAKILGLPPEPEPQRAITGADYAWTILRAMKGNNE